MMEPRLILAQTFEGTTNPLWVAAVFAFVLLNAILLSVTYLVLLERKIAAWIQDRHGPNRAGPAGLLQTIADAVKMLTKEEVAPARADRKLYMLAPLWVLAPALLGLAVVPLAGPVQIGGVRLDIQLARIDVGVLYLVALGSLGLYGLLIGGWASNNKYSFLGAMRSAAQLLSYEVPLTLALLTMVLVGGGTLRLEEFIANQSGTWFGWLPKWNIFVQPLTFIVFVTAMLAESNRLPFDLPEAEQELVAGFHTEYSAMKFGMFFMAEYAHLLTASAVLVVVFLGGWSFWGLDRPAEQTAWYFALARLAVMLGKTFLVMCVIMQIRWTLPRFRFDQLMRLSWNALTPIALALLIVNAVIAWAAMPAYYYALANVAIFVAMAIIAGLRATPITGRQRRLIELESEELKINQLTN